MPLALQRKIARARSLARLQVHRMQSDRPRFVCPVCKYAGVFSDLHQEYGKRFHAECPKCRAVERHRLQWLVLDELEKQFRFSGCRMLHMAPEAFFQARFRPGCSLYIGADLDINTKGVDRREDLTGLSFPDASFDFVYASHVLEHIPNDKAAISEVRRVLAPGGVAILPVPIVSEETIEYDAPIETEAGHVRAPGLDYFDRYARVFDQVQVYSSSDFDEKFQVYVVEDRSHWPTADMPKRRSIPGTRHSDYVPVCRVNA
jgi:SAM-dependent methyltransferase